VDEDEVIKAEVISERRHLISLAFRMLGTVAEAEDAVQETYVRWYRLGADERAAIRSPRAWLTRVASRVCLDLLSSARARRERYVGPWLPEPVPTAAFGGDTGVDPADRVTLDESVSSALLLALESLTPAERIVFVLHDAFAMPFPEIAETIGRTPAACRQLATAARRKLRAAPTRQVSRQEHDQVVRAFAAAARSGDLTRLMAVLDPRVVLRSDGGGVVSAARNPVLGTDHVARFVLGVLHKRPDAGLTELQTNDGLGYAMWEEGRIVGVITLEVGDGLVTDVKLMVNPGKLSLWN